MARAAEKEQAQIPFSKQGTSKTDTREDAADASGSGGKPLPEEDAAKVKALATRDREVRAHEHAHKAAGGGHAGAVHLEYEAGPDGKRYASSGHVPIDVSKVSGDPEATIRKMDTVRRAALAPADPSGADQQVAATAAKQASEARAELAKEARESNAQSGETEPLNESQQAQRQQAGERESTRSSQNDPAHGLSRRQAPLRLIA